jgi:ParB/RepB/Spo0J family partition protein
MRKLRIFSYSIMSNQKTTRNGSAVPETVQRIGLADLLISERNTRQPKPADVAELSLSMKETGQTTPAIVRPHPKVKGKFEIAAGARRLVAAKSAGFADLDCVVRELDDNAFEELLLVENLQREDPDPRAEVELIDRLVKRGVHTPEQISAHLGKSKHWALRRVQLLKVIPELRKLWQKGALEHYSVDMMSLLGSLPEETQKAMAREGYRIQWGLGHCNSRADVQKHLDQHWLCRLDNAAFDLNDKRFFVPGCGPGCACSSAALASLFGDDDKQPARCLKPECFSARLKLANNAKMAAIKKEHGDLPIVARDGGWSGNQEEAMFGKIINVHAVHSYDGETLHDKEKKGAKKVLVWNPQRSTLRVEWLEKKAGMASGGRTRDVKSATERLAERKAILQGKRLIVVHKELLEALAKSKHTDCVENIIDLAACFGLPEDWEANDYDAEDRFKMFDRRKTKGYEVFSDLIHDKGEGVFTDMHHGGHRSGQYEKKRDAQLWKGLRIVLADCTRGWFKVGDAPKHEEVLRRVAKLIKFPFDERKRDADRRILPPKTWGAVDIHTLEPVKAATITHHGLSAAGRKKLKAERVKKASPSKAKTVKTKANKK